MSKRCPYSKDRKLNEKVTEMKIPYKIEFCSENNLNSRLNNKEINIIAFHNLKHQEMF